VNAGGAEELGHSNNSRAWRSLSCSKHCHHMRGVHAGHLEEGPQASFVDVGLNESDHFAGQSSPPRPSTPPQHVAVQMQSVTRTFQTASGLCTAVDDLTLDLYDGQVLPSRAHNVRL
jgi:hypothetical protein